MVQGGGDRGKVPVKVGVPVEPGAGQSAAAGRGGLDGRAIITRGRG
jgi:hypothetical protein